MKNSFQAMYALALVVISGAAFSQAPDVDAQRSNLHFQIRNCRDAQDYIERETEVGKISGYVDTVKMHEAGEILVDCHKYLPEWQRQYESLGGDKAEELKQQQEAQEQAAALKMQQEEETRKDEQQVQQAPAAAEGRRKQAEQAQREADRHKRAEEMQKSLGVESAELNARAQNEWALQLIAAIEDKWARPPSVDPNMKATVKITLTPSGQVASAEISKTSGSSLYDQAVQQAIYRASPLPLPRDPSAFMSTIQVCMSANSRNCQ